MLGIIEKHDVVKRITCKLVQKITSIRINLK
jgi:hypothetical protein